MTLIAIMNDETDYLIQIEIRVLQKNLLKTRKELDINNERFNLRQHANIKITDHARRNVRSHISMSRVAERILRSRGQTKEMRSPASKGSRKFSGSRE